MTEFTCATLSSPKRVDVSSKKLQGPVRSSCSFRESSEPKSVVLGLSDKSRKRKGCPPSQKEIGGGKRLKQTGKSQPHSLESALKGKVLSGDLLKKKEMLETFISDGDSERMSLSRYLHESGFSYESQSVMVSVKSVRKDMINYLVSLFFRESENPLTDASLDIGVLRRISNRWGVIQDIVKDTEPKITAEEATLSLLKNQGLAYESMIVFLNLFERRTRPNRYDCEKKIENQKYKDIRYPLSETQFIRDVLEIAKGGYIGLKEFIEIFRIPSSKDVSEWEKVKACVWEGGDEESNLSEEVLLDEVRKCLKVAGGGKNRQALMDCLMNSELELDGKKGTFLNFLRSEYGGNLSTVDAIHVLVKCIGAHGGSKNKQAFVECLSHHEVDLGGKKVSLYTFLKLEGGLSASEAIHLLAKFIGAGGGAKNKQAFVECIRQAERDLEGETMYAFLKSKCGLSATGTIDIIVKCIGTDGGCKNKQAFIDCLTQKEVNLNGKKVSVYVFLKLEAGLSSLDAIHLLAKCIGTDGGSQNKQAFVECLTQPDVNLNGKRVSLYAFLKLEADLSASDVIHLLVKCVSSHGSSKNKQAFLECLSQPEVNLNGKRVPLYTFLKLEAGLSASAAIHLLAKCIGTDGGSKNKQAFVECLTQPEVDLGEEKVSLYTFLKLQSGFSGSDVIHFLARCVGTYGGCKNKQAFLECISQTERDLDGETVFAFLSSKCGLSATETIDTFVKCIGSDGGCKNKQAFTDSLCHPTINMNGKLVSLYTFLTSKQGGSFNAARAIRFITRCVCNAGGAKNMQVLKACFNKKIADIGGCKKSLYELFLSGKLTPKEAISLCLIFAINRCVLNITDVFCLVESKEKDKPFHSFIGLLNSLDISCYTILLNLVTKVLKYPNMTTESKRRLFTLGCQSLVCVLLDKDGYFNQKAREHPHWAVADLARRCINACVLYTGTNINHELTEREGVVVDWIRSFADDYELTEESLTVITSVQSLDDLKGLIEISNREIEKGIQKDVDDDYCEACLMAGLQILIKCKQPTIQAILKYKFMLFNWFNLKNLSGFLMILRSIKIDKLIEYFFENRKKINSMLAQNDLKTSFLIYMKFSNLTPFALQPLRLEKMQTFFESIGIVSVEELSEKNSAGVYSLYAIYARLDSLGRIAWFHEIIEGLPKIFVSFPQFRRRYLNKIQKTDWPLLMNLIKKWNLEEETVTQEELSFLIRINYQLPKDIVCSWSYFSEFKNVEKGCCVLNRTVYPNWVFALSYFQKVSTYLIEECCVVREKDRIIFESYNDIVPNTYSFPLFEIELHNEGFVFKGQSVESVSCFYAQSGLDDWCSLLETDVTKRTEDQKVSPSSDALEGGRATEFQTSSEASEEDVVSEKKTRKRKGGNIETKCEQPKKIKLFSRQEITNLYETVSRRERLTEKNCEIFMQGASYLSETMLDVLTKKSLVVEIRNKEIHERWQAFVDRYEKQKIEKVLEMIENSDTIKGLECAFPENDEKKEDPIFSELDEDLMFLIPENIEDEDMDFLNLIEFDSFFDSWETDFIYASKI